MLTWNAYLCDISVYSLLYRRKAGTYMKLNWLAWDIMN